MFAVVITEKGGAQRRLDFDKNEVTIGRVQGNDIILPKGNVSKRHSRIVLKDNRFIVVDLKSTNGTYVNGRKITSPLVVKGGDKIYIGDFILTLDEPASAGAGASGFDAAQPSPAPAPSMSAPPPPMPAPAPATSGPPPMAAPAPVPARPSAPPPLPPRPAPAPMPAAPAPAPPAPMPAAPAPAPMPAAPAPMPAAPAPMPAAPAPMPAAPAPMPAAPAPMPAAPAPLPPAPAAAAPMPAAPAPAPPAPMPVTGGAAERFPLDEEPAGNNDHAPSPRVVGSPAPTPSSQPSAPSAAPQAPAAKPAAPVAKGALAALSAVVSQAAGSFNPYEVGTPLAESDPRRAAAQRAVEAAVDAVSQSGPSFDRAAVGGAALEELVGLGAIGAILADSAVREAVVQGVDTVLIDRGEGMAPHDGGFSSAEALTVIVGRMVTAAGGFFDRSKSTHEGTLPSGVHFTAVLPPVAIGGPVVELRRIARAGLTGEQLVARGVLSSEMLQVLERAARARKGVAVIGTSDAGVAQLVSAVANLGSDGRVLAIEVAPELELGGDALRLTAPAGTPFETVIQQSARLRADRVVIHGVRGGEALAALTAASARSGSVIGVHSQSGPDALAHLAALCRIGGGADAVTHLIGSAASLIVRVGRDDDGAPRVESLGEVRVDGPDAKLEELFGSGFTATGQTPSF